MTGGLLRAGVLLAVALYAIPAQSTVIYSYSSDLYAVVHDLNPPAGTYTTAMRMTGSFTVANPIAVSHTFADDLNTQITSFSFDDGRFTTDNSNAASSNFQVQTDGAGSIEFWNIALSTLSGLTSDLGLGEQAHTTLLRHQPPATIVNSVFLECVALDVTGTCSVVNSDFANVTTQGTWNAVPEPSTALLLGLGLAALGRSRPCAVTRAQRRPRRRAAAGPPHRPRRRMH